METSPRTIPHPTSPCHQASNSRQPASSSSSFTIRTDDRFVITRESDILYTLRVIEKRLLSMHCGLPWWREEGVISKGTRYDANPHIPQYFVFQHTRGGNACRARAVLPVYETQYTWPLSILRFVCRQQLTRGAQSADRERGTRYTRAQDGVI